MIKAKKAGGAVLAAVSLFQTAIPSAHACAVCFGAPGEKASDAAVQAILFMLVVVGIVFAGIAGAIIAYVRRVRKMDRAGGDGLQARGIFE